MAVPDYSQGRQEQIGSACQIRSVPGSRGIHSSGPDQVFCYQSLYGLICSAWSMIAAICN